MTAARARQTMYVIGPDCRPVAQTTELHIIARDSESPRLFLERVCGHYPLQCGDRITFVVRAGKIVQARVLRTIGTPQAETVTASPVLRAVVQDLIARGYGTTTFVLDSNDVLLHEETIITQKLAPTTELTTIIAAAGSRPGDKITVAEDTVYITRTALPAALLMAVVQ